MAIQELVTTNPEHDSADVQAARSYSTYSSFPRELYQRFVDLYVQPYVETVGNCLDLGCGSGGLVEVLNGRFESNILGIDVSELSIERCRQNPRLDRPNISFMTTDATSLENMADLKHRFDLLVSYSVLHLVPATTEAKFELLQNLTKPGAILAIDAMPRTLWNVALMSVIRFLFQIGVGGTAIKWLGPIVAPKMPKNYIHELSKINYLGTLRTTDFLDLSYFQSRHFLDAFQVLRWDILPQGGFLTGRKLRMTLRRK